MNILVGNDGSERSLDALPHAARIAAATGGTLTLLRVLDADEAGGEAQSLDELGRHSAALGGTTPGVTATTAVVVRGRNEDVAAAFLRAATEHGADMLCTSTRGAGLLRRAVIGSVAMRLLQQSVAPLMLTGERIAAPRSDEPYRALVTADGSPDSEAVLPSLARVFPDTAPAPIMATLLHIYESSLGDYDRQGTLAECERMLRDLAGRLPAHIQAEQSVRELKALSGIDQIISDTAEEAGADSIWMATHGHSVARQALLGSVALGTLGRATVPVVLVRAAH